MSTKRLQRTVIEGGRRNTDERRKSHKEQRATERAYMAAVTKDPENFDEIALEETDHVYKEFSDKLNPMERWLESQVGRRWSEVRSEVAQKFDTRTTAGRHITFDHLLSSVVDTISGRDKRGYIADASLAGDDGTPRYYSFHDYFVDANDVLCKNPKRQRSWWRSGLYGVSVEQHKAMSDFLQGRMIGEKGGVLYWLTSLDGVWKTEWTKLIEQTKYGPREGPIALKYYCQEVGPFEEKIYINDTFAPPGYYETRQRTGLHWEMIQNPAGFKQRGPLNSDEVKTFRQFPSCSQTEILTFGKARIN